MTPTNPTEMMAAVAASMKSRTGRTVDEWVQVVAASGLNPLDQQGVRRWLKSAHGVAQNSQWTIADAAAQAAGWRPPTVEEYIDQQYAGSKQALRPLFDRLRTILEGFGSDVTVEGRSTYTPFVRRRQCCARPTNRTVELPTPFPVVRLSVDPPRARNATRGARRRLAPSSPQDRRPLRHRFVPGPQSPP